MAKLRKLGWVNTKTQAARGRVATYAIDFNQISTTTQEIWASVGPDFVERMAGLYPATVVKVDFGNGGGQGEFSPDMSEPTGKWGDMRALLLAQDESVFRNWFARLQFESFSERSLRLTAESSFLARYIETHLSQALLAAAIQVFGPVESLQIAQG